MNSGMKDKLLEVSSGGGNFFVLKTFKATSVALFTSQVADAIWNFNNKSRVSGTINAVRYVKNFETPKIKIKINSTIFTYKWMIKKIQNTNLTLISS